MAVDAGDTQVWQRVGSPVDLECLVDIDTELVVAQAGRDVRVRLGIDIGIDANRDRRELAALGRDAVEAFEFGAA